MSRAVGLNLTRTAPKANLKPASCDRHASTGIRIRVSACACSSHSLCGDGCLAHHVPSHISVAWPCSVPSQCCNQKTGAHVEAAGSARLAHAGKVLAAHLEAALHLVDGLPAPPKAAEHAAGLLARCGIAQHSPQCRLHLQLPTAHNSSVDRAHLQAHTTALLCHEQVEAAHASCLPLALVKIRRLLMQT